QPAVQMSQSNSFSWAYIAIARDYIPLRSSEQAVKMREWKLTFLCSLTHRFLGVGRYLLGTAIYFIAAFITSPLITTEPAKFALLFR
ncbi:hypothetical protein CPB84DRAFT_1640191, partial [Gymnopilus junonius]